MWSFTFNNGVINVITFGTLKKVATSGVKPTYEE